MQLQVSNEHCENILKILRQLLRDSSAFAVGNETTSWTHGLRFTIYDVRSTTSATEVGPFDDLTWEIEDALREAGYPVSAVMKGQRLCMLDVDCRTAQSQAPVERRNRTVSATR